MRTALSVLSSAALLTLVAQVLAAGVLWSQGRLNADAIREIRLILNEPAGKPSPESLVEKKPAVSVDDVTTERAIRILHLEERQNEQEILRALVADSRAGVLKEQATLREERKLFDQKQTEKLKQQQNEALEKTRSVLLKTEAALAMAQLMNLSVEENVALLEGMSEKKIAELLQAFSAGDKSQQERGRLIFQALSRGRLESPAESTSPGTTL